MIRVAIIGCGKVADKHASQIKRLPNARIVGVCDREELMARQLAERMRVERWFSDVGDMLADSQPDVVHITTPPQSHYCLTKLCLESGCHVYVEKPFTLTALEAADLIDAAEKHNLKVTVGHETQFAPVSVDLRRLVREGYLGGPPVHIESVYCYDFSDERYARALLGDSRHWVRSLPGGLLHNIISHGIGKIAEYLPGEEVEVVARGFTSRFLKSIGESDIVDELRVIMVDNNRTTAYFTFSSQMGPPLHQFRIYGPSHSVITDLDHQTLVRLPGKYKSYLDQFIPPLLSGREYISNGLHNIRKFLKRDLHAESGIYTLISSFYRSLRESCALPISYHDILLTSRIMDKIFQQIHNVSHCGEQAASEKCFPDKRRRL